jgi:ubiquinone biosynthesis protein UbiJ
MNIMPLLGPFESLVNRNIGASTPARALLRSLAGRSFAVEVSAPGGGPRPRLRLRLAASELGLNAAQSDEPADATVAGTPLGLVALLAGRAGGRLATGGATVTGDADVAQAFEKLLGYARPDPEEELARLVGDIPAHYAADAARAALAFGRRAGDSLTRSLAEFLTEESRDLVPRAELDAFAAGVDRTRDDVERAAARLTALERRLAPDRR